MTKHAAAHRQAATFASTTVEARHVHKQLVAAAQRHQHHHLRQDLPRQAQDQVSRSQLRVLASRSHHRVQCNRFLLQDQCSRFQCQDQCNPFLLQDQCNQFLCRDRFNHSLLQDQCNRFLCQDRFNLSRRHRPRLVCNQRLQCQALQLLQVHLLRCKATLRTCCLILRLNGRIYIFYFLSTMLHNTKAVLSGASRDDVFFINFTAIAYSFSLRASTTSVGGRVAHGVFQVLHDKSVQCCSGLRMRVSKVGKL